MTQSEPDDLIGDLDRRGKMEAMFFEHLPNHRLEDGTRISMFKIAQDLEMTRQGVNYWFTREKIGFNQLEKLIRLEGSTLTIEMLYPYSIPE